MPQVQAACSLPRQPASSITHAKLQTHRSSCPRSACARKPLVRWWVIVHASCLASACSTTNAGAGLRTHRSSCPRSACARKPLELVVMAGATSTSPDTRSGYLDTQVGAKCQVPTEAACNNVSGSPHSVSLVHHNTVICCIAFIYHRACANVRCAHSAGKLANGLAPECSSNGDRRACGVAAQHRPAGMGPHTTRRDCCTLRAETRQQAITFLLPALPQLRKLKMDAAVTSLCPYLPSTSTSLQFSCREMAAYSAKTAGAKLCNLPLKLPVQSELRTLHPTHLSMPSMSISPMHVSAAASCV